MNNSIVLELEKEIIDKNCDILSALRKAHIIASKLKLNEFDHWITCELKGYKEHDTIPEYRKLKGIVKAHNTYYGWIPVLFEDNEFQNMFNTIELNNPINEIIEYYSASHHDVKILFNGEKLQVLNKATDASCYTQMALFINVALIGNIIEQAKLNILEWVLKLEDNGIFGESMIFNSKEKKLRNMLQEQLIILMEILQSLITMQLILLYFLVIITL